MNDGNGGLDVCISERLRMARINKRISQRDAAQALGVWQTIIVRMEQGKRAMRADECHKLANLYGVSMQWLMGCE